MLPGHSQVRSSAMVSSDRRAAQKAKKQEVAKKRPAEAALAGEDWELVVPKASTAAGHHADTQRRAAVDAATALVDGLLAAGCPPTALRDLLKSEDLRKKLQEESLGGDAGVNKAGPSCN